MKIRLSKNGLTKKVSTGFSMWYFWFGILYTLSNGDSKGVFSQFIALTLTFGLAWFVFIFTYNKNYIKRLIEDDYKPVDTDSADWLYRKLGYTVENK